MNIRILSLVGICSLAGFNAWAQSADDSAPKRSPDELNELLGPIALYPDPLISLILPASTVPSDIVLADRYAEKGGDPDATDDMTWDASVKGLVRYPDTLKWLDDNLDWTSQVGDAFTSQPVDVMEAIQALRAKAKDVGNLVDTPQEKIVQDDNEIRILPAEEDSICVPSYDPEVIYERRIVDAPAVEFSEPYTVGPWLGYDFDWHHHHLYWGEWHRGWHYHHERDSRVFINDNFTNTKIWHVDVKRRKLEVDKHPLRHVAVVPGRRPGKIVVPHPKPLVVAGHGPGHHPGPVVTGGKAGPGGKTKFNDPKAFELSKGKAAEKGIIKGDHPGKGGKVMEPKAIEAERLAKERAAEKGTIKGEHPGKGGKVMEPKAIEAERLARERAAEKGIIKGEGKGHVEGSKKLDPKPHVDMPKKVEHRDEPKKVEHREMPKKVEHREEPRKVEHREEPKKVEHREAPKKVEHREEPRKVEHREEPRKVEHHEAPKKVEHHEAPKGRTESRDGKDGKKKDHN